MPEVKLTTNTPQETLELGSRLGEILDRPVEIDLIGDLGAGKTLFAKGVAAGMGIDPAEIRSPTYLVMSSYEGRLPLRHIDLYRLDEPGEVEKLGLLPEELSGAVVLIEWAEKVELGLEQPELHVEFVVTGENTREITLSADSDLAGLVERFQQR